VRGARRVGEGGDDAERIGLRVLSFVFFYLLDRGAYPIRRPGRRAAQAVTPDRQLVATDHHVYEPFAK